MNHLLPLVEYAPQYQLLFSDASSSDEMAQLALLDFVKEEGFTVNPFEMGKSYFIETQTLYYCGKVTAVSPCWIKLTKASWVHWTGRKGTLLSYRSFDKKNFKGGERAPRTEFVGDMLLAIGGVNAAFEWPEENLPTVSLQ